MTAEVTRPRMITARGKTQSVADWSHETGIPYGALWRRIYVSGWSAERALTTTTRRGRAKKLTEDDVREIRRAHDAGDASYAELAARHGVTVHTVRDVVRRKTWRRVA